MNAVNASTVVTFEIGLSTSYGTTVTADESPVTGTTNTAVSKNLTGLIPRRTYHYRVVTVNAGGTTHGEDQTFMTLSPEMDIRLDGASLAVGDDANFGPVGRNGQQDLQFMVHNLGASDLHLTLPVTLTGPQAADYSVVTAPAAVVAPLDSTPVIIRFAPTTLGEKVATFSLASDDEDENPYTLTLKGTGANNPPSIYSVEKDTLRYVEDGPAFPSRLKSWFTIMTMPNWSGPGSPSPLAMWPARTP